MHADVQSFSAFPLPPQDADRRRVGRVTPATPLRARIGHGHAEVIDISLHGAGLEHAELLPVRVGQHCIVGIEWEGKTISARCEIVRTRVRSLRACGAAVYNSGLRFIELLNDSALVLRQLVAAHVARALEEQKADARGIPAPHDGRYERRRTAAFLRCELRNGRWSKIATADPAQPPLGFTIDANEPPAHVAMLCQAFEKADSGGRTVITTFAALSLSNGDDTSTRRYLP